MSDLFIWGGPVTNCQPTKIAWVRPTVAITLAADGSSNMASIYASLKQTDGYGWRSAARKAGLDPESVDKIALAGFSAFHGFADAWLANPEDRARTTYVHLADACFSGAGSTVPKAGYLAYAALAADPASGKMLTTTTNGPWGQDIHYAGPDGTQYDLTSGSKCFGTVWDAATGGATGDASDVPSGAPPPTRIKRVGNLAWFHYETAVSGYPTPCGGASDAHVWHANVLAIPYIQAYGVPFMAGETSSVPIAGLSGSAGKVISVAAGVGLGYLAYRALRRRRDGY